MSGYVVPDLTALRALIASAPPEVARAEEAMRERDRRAALTPEQREERRRARIADWAKTVDPDEYRAILRGEKLMPDFEVP